MAAVVAGGWTHMHGVGPLLHSWLVQVPRPVLPGRTAAGVCSSASALHDQRICKEMPTSRPHLRSHCGLAAMSDLVGVAAVLLWRGEFIYGSVLPNDGPKRNVAGLRICRYP